MTNFWHKLKRPIKALAPMENVTDTVFRRIVGRCGAPDVYFTEFTNVDWLFTNPKLRARSIHRLDFTEDERPLVAQVWGSQPENYYKAAQMIAEMGFDGIDINMGCPAAKIRRKACCSGLIRFPKLASEIIQATQEGAGALPVSVKTRMGLDRIVTEEWCSHLLTHQLDVLTIHGRLAKEMSKFPANWDEVAKVVSLRNQISPRTLILGNGDVKSLKEVDEKHKQYGVDGVMIGRGIFEDLHLFDPVRSLTTLTKEQKIALLVEHAQLFVDTWGARKDFNILKKFFKIYTTGFEGALPLREALMQKKNLEEVLQALQDHDSSRR